MITMKPVDSALVKAWGYDYPNKILYLQLSKKDEIHLYHDVSVVVAGLFEDAPSKGKFFHQHIKGQFRFTVVGKVPLDG